MCGIVGYIGERDCAQVLLDGLGKLEYRGYDSSGVSIFENGEIKTVKSKGRLSDLKDKLRKTGCPKGKCGIGHTRWATHGEPSDLNSHPHSNGKIALVHNGIIENHAQIKEILQARGYVFHTQTDTETIVNLLDSNYSGDPLQAIALTLPLLKGSYALGILFYDHPDQLFAVRKDSPLIAAVGEHENLIASDVPAILRYTKKYYLLEEGEIATLTEDDIVFTRVSGARVVKEIQIADWDVEAAQKGGYPHFMLKEIHEEPEALRRALKPRFENGELELKLKESTEKALATCTKIKIVACGTALNAGMVGQSLIEQLARVPAEIQIASEFRYNDPILDSSSLVLIISQSGETADSLASLRLARAKGAATLAIVNVLGSSIAREADDVLYTWAGPEIAVASTKAYSVQVAILSLLAFELAYKRGKIDLQKRDELCRELCRMPEFVEKVFTEELECKRLAALQMNTRSLFYMGRGIDYALCAEGSLKFKEISYIHSDAYAAGELKHGTISLVCSGVNVMALSTQRRLWEKMSSNIREVKARGGEVIIVCQEGSDQEGLADQLLTIPAMPDMFTAIPTMTLLQLFAYYTSVLRGNDVDRPRNLAKSVTVE